MQNKNIPKTTCYFFYFFIRKNPMAFFVFFLSPSCVILETNVMPYGLKMFVDKISSSGGIGTDQSLMVQTLPAIVLIISSWIAMTLITRFSSYWQCTVIPQFVSDIRMTMFQHVVGRSYAFFLDNMVGNISSKINDLPETCDRIRQIISWNILSTSIVVITSCIMLLTVHYIFTMIFVIWCIVHMSLVLIRSKYINTISSVHAENQTLLTGAITDEIQNIVSIKSHIYNFPHYSSINKYRDNELDSNIKLHKNILTFEIILDIPILIMFSFILYFLIVNLEYQLITPGDFVLTFNIVVSSMYSMVSLGHVLVEIFKDAGRIKQALAVLVDNQKEKQNKSEYPLIIKSGEINFKNVQFSYLGSDIFKFNQIIEGKKNVAIVGYSGSGKSSFIKLILRLNAINSGQILIDNQNINEVSEQTLMRNISYVSQDATLFHGSILENIKIGNQHATKEQIIDIAKKSHCHEFIMQMPNQYETIVGSSGAKLSGGQKQLIMIARALIKNSPVVIFDEATSFLDRNTQNSVMNSIKGFSNSKTVLIVAHRLSSVSFCDKILFFKDKEIIETGTHQELLDKKGEYYQMWNLQQ